MPKGSNKVLLCCHFGATFGSNNESFDSSFKRRHLIVIMVVVEKNNKVAQVTLEIIKF